MSGRVVHFEIPYDDGERARRFYKEAFDWQLQEMPGMDYTLVVSGPERRHAGRPNPGSSTAACWRARRAPRPARSSSSTCRASTTRCRPIERLGGSTVVPEAAGRRDGLHRLREGPRGQRRSASGRPHRQG